MIAILFLQLYHMIQMDFGYYAASKKEALRGGLGVGDTLATFKNDSATGVVGNKNEQVTQKHSVTADTQQEEESSRRKQEQTKEPKRRRPVEESFSACLMFMDDNAHLIEWLAYHYHSLPLRRLIVAIDPRSKTSPSSILERWHDRMEITEWSEVDFMPPRLMDAHAQELTPVALTRLFRQRQEEFYARCMARLKYEGRTWVALVDTDEYIQPNFHSHRHDAYLRSRQQQQIEKNPMTVLDLLKPREHDTHVVDHNPEAKRAAEQESKLAQQLELSPCFPMARLSFGVKESDSSELHNNDISIPWGFNPLDFQTLRWRWHAGRSKKSVNKISKALMDVSRVDSSLFIPTEQVMVHLPVKEHCRGEEDLWILNTNSLLVVHHYGGTWEQWSRRGSSDPRGKRTREAYDQMKYDKQVDDTIRPWLAVFVKEVGWWTARRLLHNVGRL